MGHPIFFVELTLTERSAASRNPECSKGPSSRVTRVSARVQSRTGQSPNLKNLFAHLWALCVLCGKKAFITINRKERQERKELNLGH